MSVDAIGSTLATQDPSLPANSNINEQDFIKLFVSELQFQDPMQPVDNGQFLTELAQFVGIEEQQETVRGVNNLLTLDSTDSALGLLNHTVEFGGAPGSASSTGTVAAVQFDQNGATLSIQTSGGNVVTGIRLSQINQIIH